MTSLRGWPMTSLADNWRVCRLIRREGWCVRRPEATTAGRTSSTCRWGARRWPTSIGQVHPARPCPGTQCTSWPWGSWCPGWRWWCTTPRWSSSLRPSPQICCPEKNKESFQAVSAVAESSRATQKASGKNENRKILGSIHRSDKIRGWTLGQQFNSRRWSQEFESCSD